MTAGICFHMEAPDTDLWSGRELDLDAWRYAAKAYGVTRLAVINTSGEPVSITDEEISLTVYASLDDFEVECGGHTCVYLEAEWSIDAERSKGVEIVSTSLPDFTHTADTWYIFGPAAGHVIVPGKTWVSVPQNNTGAQHAVHLCPVVLYDRYRRSL